MSRRLFSKLWRLSLAGLTAAWMSSCSIGDIYGHVQYVTQGDYQQAVSNLQTGAHTGVCLVDNLGHEVECTYEIDDETITSTTHLVAERALGVIEDDPLILEVPANVISPTGTYDAGGGPLPLPIRRANSFAVQPGTRITAEVGTAFLFFDLPLSVTSGLPITNPAAGPVFSYTLSFQQQYPLSATVPPVMVKPMMAGAVTILWQTYYVPLLPCVTSFASIPAVTIPQSSTPQHLEATLGDLIRNHSVGPCNHKTYDFTQATPPPGLLFLPLVGR